MQQDASAIVAAVLTAARAGDLVAARMVLDRIAPACRERHVELDLPVTDTPDGIAQAQGVVIAAVSTGHLTPGQGAGVASLLDGRRRALETVELAARLEALESKQRP